MVLCLLKHSVQEWGITNVPEGIFLTRQREWRIAALPAAYAAKIRAARDAGTTAAREKTGAKAIPAVKGTEKKTAGNVRNTPAAIPCWKNPA